MQRILFSNTVSVFSVDHTKTCLHTVEDIGTCCADICLYILMNELRLVSVSEKQEKTKQLSLIKISLEVRERQAVGQRVL
jgi:hypothetical protein